MIADFFLFDSPPSYLYAYLLLDETNNLVQLTTYQVFHILMVLTYFVSNKPKGRISKPVFQENKAHQIFRKKNISYSLIRRRMYTQTYVCVSGSKKCLFFGKFGEFCFLETPVLRFALLPYYRRISSGWLHSQ